MGERNIVDILLDEKNEENIVFNAPDGKNLVFKQIAVIPYDDTLYCILKPVDSLNGTVADDEAIVFYIEESDERNPYLLQELDELKTIRVFLEYYHLLREKLGDENKKLNEQEAIMQNRLKALIKNQL